MPQPAVGPRPARVHVLDRHQVVPRPVSEVFAFFADAANLERITPTFVRFAVATPMPIEMREGTRIDYVLTLFGIRMGWRTRIAEWEPGRRFVDEQESGPYAFWRHVHAFEGHGDDTVIRDRVEYALPFAPIGDLAHGAFVRPTLERIFDHRQAVVARAFGGGRAGDARAGDEPAP